MNIFEQLKGHKVVEANNLQGLRTGHMVAQARFKGESGTDGNAFLDNGHILVLGKDNELTLSADGTGNALLHYSEEHMKFLDSASLDMFTVVLDGKAYPRAIALYHGDTFTTDNFKGNATAEFTEVGVTNGVLDYEAATKVAIAKKSALPTGKEAIEVVWFGGAN